jgi:mannitol/fructose-specific phosphotransferase system IIA component (Ntr-type)
MNIIDTTRPQLLVSTMSATDPQTAIRELAAAIAAEGIVTDVEAFVQTVLGRERLGSTDLEPCWALPHGRVKGLARPWFALGRVSTPILWGKTPVRLVMLMAAPDPDVEGRYLKLIAGFARLNRKSALADRLLKAAGNFEMFEAIREASAPVEKAIL